MSSLIWTRGFKAGNISQLLIKNVCGKRQLSGISCALWNNLSSCKKKSRQLALVVQGRTTRWACDQSSSFWLLQFWLSHVTSCYMVLAVTCHTTGYDVTIRDLSHMSRFKLACQEMSGCDVSSCGFRGKISCEELWCHFMWFWSRDYMWHHFTWSHYLSQARLCKHSYVKYLLGSYRWHD